MDDKPNGWGLDKGEGERGGEYRKTLLIALVRMTVLIACLKYGTKKG